MPARLQINVVGKGRVGTSLAQAWGRKGHRVRFPEIKKALYGDVAVLAVPDQAIADVVTKLTTSGLQYHVVVAHTSGATDLSVFEPLKAWAHDHLVAPLHAGSLHPLCAVYRQKMELKGAFAAIDGDSRAQSVLKRLARDAGMKTFANSPKDRARYHLAAVLAANSLAPLLALSTELMASAGIRPSEAQSGLLALMESSLAALEKAGPIEGLTGPVARGDVETLKRHLSVLGRDEALLARIYSALNLAAVQVARKRSAVPPNLDAIAKLLK
jgi:predicted short-subunit dehydrogenase-like oxidoreductase (DUF2520 family)